MGEIVRGNMLARPRTLMTSMMLDGSLNVLSSSPVPIKDLARVHLHLGTAQVVTRVRVLGGRGAIDPGEEGLVQFRLEAAISAVPGDRFIIRRYSPLETLGGGAILDAAPAKHSVLSAQVVERLGALRAEDPVQQASFFVADAGVTGLTGDDLARRLGANKETLNRIVSSLVNQTRAIGPSEKPLRIL